MDMIRVYSDFNDRDPLDGACLNLWIEDLPLERRAEELGLKIGSKIVLYQDENDFEVVATLESRNVSGTDRLVAVPDWSTIRRF